MNPILRQQSPEASLDLPPTPDVTLISEYTHPYGMNYVKVEAVSLVTGLAGTGSDPPPSPQRAALLGRNEPPRRRPIPTTCSRRPTRRWCWCRRYLRPGIQEGDHFDVEVRVPSRSETTSLRGGWLLPARLTEMAVLGEQIRQGNVLGNAEGPVLVDPSADPKNDPALVTRGRVLGGGVSAKSRSLGLVVGHQHQSIRMSQQIAAAINHRFYTHVDGRKQGVATPKTEEFIELVAPPALQRQRRPLHARGAQHLRQRVGPAICRTGCCCWNTSWPIRSPPPTPPSAWKRSATNRPSRFSPAPSSPTIPKSASTRPRRWPTWTRPPAVATLAAVARDEPAFRVNALAASSAMDDVMAYDALCRPARRAPAPKLATVRSAPCGP